MNEFKKIHSKSQPLKPDKRASKINIYQEIVFWKTDKSYKCILLT